MSFFFRTPWRAILCNDRNWIYFCCIFCLKEKEEKGLGTSHSIRQTVGFPHGRHLQNSHTLEACDWSIRSHRTGRATRLVHPAESPPFEQPVQDSEGHVPHVQCADHQQRLPVHPECVSGVDRAGAGTSYYGW